MSTDQPEGRIKKALKDSRKGPLKAKELAKILKIPGEGYRAFRDLLFEMERRGDLYRVKGQRFSIPEKINLKVGLLQVTRNEDGFVLTDDSGGDIYVPGSQLNSAMDGDQVVVRVEGGIPTGESSRS